MNQRPDIDALLNAFLDDELSQRQQTEVKRLIRHDKGIAGKLKQLKKCRDLVGSLPIEIAPDGLVEQVKAKLEKRETLPADAFEKEQLQGQKYLFKRNLVSMAAMVALAACLAIVVYTIVVPEKVTKRPVAIEKSAEPEQKIIVEKTEPQLVAAKTKLIDNSVASSYEEISAKLKLTTNNFVAVDAFITRAIEDNGLLEYSIPKQMSRKGVYSIRCSKENLNPLLYDLQSVWTKFDSAVLSIDDSQEGEITIEDVLPAQIAKIIKAGSIGKSAQIAKDFAISNNITGAPGQKNILVNIGPNQTDLMNIPKPVLTSNDKKVKKPVDVVAEQRLIIFTIVVAAQRVDDAEN